MGFVVVTLRIAPSKITKATITTVVKATILTLLAKRTVPTPAILAVAVAVAVVVVKVVSVIVAVVVKVVPPIAVVVKVLATAMIAAVTLTKHHHLENDSRRRTVWRD